MGDEKKREGAGMSRRTFALGVGGAGVLLAMGGLKLVPAEAQVRPPGGQDESRLVASCIRCERCVEACPRGALRPAHIEDGIVSVRTPTTNFNDGWCDFCADENDGVPLCVAACPGQACFLVDPEFAPEEATVDFPFEYLPLPQPGTEVEARDNMGRNVCTGRVIQVRQGAGGTQVVRIAVPAQYAYEVRGMKPLSMP